MPSNGLGQMTTAGGRAGKQLAKHWCHKEDGQFATNSAQGVSQLEGSSDKS